MNNLVISAGKRAGKTMEAGRLFAVELRKAILQSGVTPVFELKVVAGRVFVMKVKRLNFDVTPFLQQVFIRDSLIAQQSFQDSVNWAFRIAPLRMSGVIDVRATYGKRDILLENVPWSVRIVRIDGLKRDEAGYLSVTSLTFEDHSFNGGPLKISLSK